MTGRFLLAFAMIASSVLGQAGPTTASSGPAAPPATWAGSTPVPVEAAAMASTTNRYVPVTPTRVLDTRIGVGAPVGPVGAGGTLVLQLAGPSKPVPAQATAVVFNLAATEPQGAAFVTVYPDGEAMPTSSSLNIDYAGQTVSVLVTASLGNGAVRIYSLTRTHLVADLAGYYLPTATSTIGRFVPIVPTRLADTRTGPGRVGRLETGQSFDLDVVKGAGLPADATAVVLNVTATEPVTAGYLSITPAGEPPGQVSSLNVARARQTIGNQVVVPLRGGAITIYASMPTHVVVDLGGWYTGPSAPAGGDGLFVPLVPGRLLDTRDRTNSPLLGMKPAANDTIDVTASGRNTIPASGVAAVVVTAVVTNSDAAGFLTFFGAGLGRPPTSNLNTDSPGRTIANHAVVPVSTAGLSAYTSAGAHLIVDVAGYVTGPTPAAPAGYRPAIGSPPTTGPHSFLYRMVDGSFARWDPCSPITFKVNYSGAPAFARTELARAVAKVEAATGLDLVDTGETTAGNDRTPPPGTKAVVSFVSPAENPSIAGVAGLGGGAYYPPWNGLDAYVAQGFVHINETLAYSQGTGPTGLEGLLLHELGHMVGLDHVDATTEVMYPVMHTLPFGGYGPGDRQGLWGLGVMRGCLNTGVAGIAGLSFGDPTDRLPVTVISPQATGGTSTERSPVVVSFCGIGSDGAPDGTGHGGLRRAEVATPVHPAMLAPPVEAPGGPSGQLL